MPPRRSSKAATKPAKQAASAVPEPIVAPQSKVSGRERVYTSKQQDNAADKANKEAVKKNKLYREALRVRQGHEEISGFTPSTRGSKDPSYMPPESEDEENDPLAAVVATDTSAFSLRPAVKTSVRNGKTLVCRVPSTEYVSQATTASAPPRTKPLVRRAGGGFSQGPSPAMVLEHPYCEEDAPAQHREDSERHHAHPGSYTREDSQRYHARPGPYTPHVQASFGGGDGTYYHSHPDTEQSDDEEFTGVDHIVNYQEPRHYVYPNAHSELESFPRSGLSASPDGHSTLGIRKSPPPTMSVASTITIKKPKVETTGSRGRVRASDFDDLSKTVLEDAIAEYRARICTQDPYPDRIRDREWGTSVWVAACAARGVQIEFEESALKLITQRSSQVRGQLKTVARPLLEPRFDINAFNDKRTNRDIVEDLLDHISFVYKDSKERIGIFRNPIIQAIVNKMWFKNRTDEGVIRPEFTSEDGGITLVVLALVIVVIECCLHEWQTGEHVDVPFSASVYHDRFLAHLKTLQEFEAKTKDMDIMLRLRRHILKVARKHAKVDDAPAAQTVQLAETDFEAAKKEWESLVLSDEE
ncbi:hypothetical protein Hypma_000275 [Hypsizygus marmoreus]|uniref:DUF6532 domain-containing protein n=1 Tax=Hypsizygus marmoreus TaxID=39966 RepID=A0A369J8U5_HYPMA|nr:hypothetical protein Hypma_000275 [Hypsizygus marmoreus]